MNTDDFKTTENGNVWCPRYKGIMCSSKEELVIEIRKIEAKRNWQNFCDIFDAISTPIIRITLIVLASFAVVKFVKFLWYV